MSIDNNYTISMIDTSEGSELLIIYTITKPMLLNTLNLEEYDETF